LQPAPAVLVVVLTVKLPLLFLARLLILQARGTMAELIVWEQLTLVLVVAEAQGLLALTEQAGLLVPEETAWLLL
jgi:hypothetical protein